jgi:hypothetical protein
MITDGNTSDLLTSREAADMLRISPATLAIWRCRDRYQLPYIKVGSHVVYRRGDIENFLKSRTVGKK